MGGGNTESGNGIYSYASENTTITGNFIYENSGNAARSGNGINLEDSDDNNVTGNTIHDNIGGSGTDSGNGIFM